MTVSPLAGRAAELAELAGLVRGAHDGRFGAVVVEGDAGIGKTSLVRTACAAADDADLVLSGACLPLTAVSIPLQGLRSAARGVPEEERPAFLRRPGVEGEGPGGPPSAGQPGPVAVDDWLTGLCADRAVVLVVDDLHWADEETLDALMYVLAGPPRRRLAVVLTVRSSEVGPGHRLRRWLADARRLPEVAELTLGPLSREALTELVAGEVGGQPHSSLLDAVEARSRGNPYFARLLVAGLEASARSLPPHLPEKLSSAAVRSWESLSRDARRFLVTLAIGGHPVAGGPLHRVADLAGLTDPGPAVREAVDVGLLDLAEDGSVWFHHPLQAEALEQGLLPDQRRALHAGFAVEYAEDAERDPSAELAEAVSDHFALADRSAEARDWAVRAARALRGSGDEVGRLRMLRRAVALAEEATPLRRALLVELRDVAEEVADWEAEREATLALRETLDEEVDDEALLLAVLDARLGTLGFVTERGETSGDLDRALALSARRPVSWQRLFVVAEYVHIVIWDGLDAAVPVAELEVLLRAELPVDGTARDGLRRDRAVAYALSALAMHASMTDSAAGHEAGRRAADAAAACSDGFSLLDAAFWEANSLTTRTTAWVEAVERRLAQMVDLGIAHPYFAWLCASEAHMALCLGEVRLCSDRLRVALGADSGPAGDFLARLGAALLACGQGRRHEAEAHLARATELLRGGTSFPAFNFERTSAAVRLAAGDPEGAVSAALAGLSVPVSLPTECEWLAPLAAQALADLALGARDHHEDPVPHLARLAELRERWPQTARDVGELTEVYVAELAALDGWYSAEVARAHAAGTGEQWREVADLFARVEHPWEEAYACRRSGEAFLQGEPGGGQRRDAAAVLRRGHSLAVRLGAAPTREAIEAVARSARIPLTSVAAPGGAPTVDGVRLTAREREVLAHVVAGRTYAEIAAALFLSEKTVSSHISNILHKTGTTNRVELAGWATRRDA